MEIIVCDENYVRQILSLTKIDENSLALSNIYYFKYFEHGH